MRVWISKKRERGVAAQLSPLVDEPVPVAYELVIMGASDQGQHRLTKVARAMADGEKRIVAELIAPRLVKLRSHALVLSGIEHRRNEYGRVVGTPQTWICELAPPFSKAVPKVARMFDVGVPVDRRQLRDSCNGDWAPDIAVDYVAGSKLGRPTTEASKGKGVYDSHLLDVDLLWMGRDAFALGGVECHGVHGQRPETWYEQGWYCMYAMPEAKNSVGRREKHLF